LATSSTLPGTSSAVERDIFGDDVRPRRRLIRTTRM
jgi:hypothetical protein